MEASSGIMRRCSPGDDAGRHTQKPERRRARLSAGRHRELVAAPGVVCTHIGVDRRADERSAGAVPCLVPACARPRQHRDLEAAPALRREVPISPALMAALDAQFMLAVSLPRRGHFAASAVAVVPTDRMARHQGDDEGSRDQRQGGVAARPAPRLRHRHVTSGRAAQPRPTLVGSRPPQHVSDLCRRQRAGGSGVRGAVPASERTELEACFMTREGRPA